METVRQYHDLLNTPSEKRHLWHRLEPTALLLAVVVAPGVIWFTGTNSDREKLRFEYVRLAIISSSHRVGTRIRRMNCETGLLKSYRSRHPYSFRRPPKEALISGESNLSSALANVGDPSNVKNLLDQQRVIDEARQVSEAEETRLKKALGPNSSNPDLFRRLDLGDRYFRTAGKIGFHARRDVGLGSQGLRFLILDGSQITITHFSQGRFASSEVYFCEVTL